jgi:glucokinase
MAPILVVDLGGTRMRLALVFPGGRPTGLLAIDDGGLAGPHEVIAAYLARCSARPEALVLAVAGLVDGDLIHLTNRGWRFSLTALAKEFGFARIHAINDFEAIAWSLSQLDGRDVKPLGPAAIGTAGGAKVVFGPGTGLGVAALVPGRDGWHVIATEGGHVGFGPASDDEERTFARLRATNKWVSAETVLSGPGLARLHAALHDGEALSPKSIEDKARAGEPRAGATIALFVRLLGRFAGDLALMFKATGGVYLSGGVARHIESLIDTDAFRAAFVRHPPYEETLAATPTWLITLEEPGLLGCALIAEQVFGAQAS